MTLQQSVRYALLLGALALAVDGCARASSTAPWPVSTDPVVFEDTFGANVIFQAFGGSKLDALSLDTIEQHSGTTSLKISVPATGLYAGGALTTNRPRDLSGYNALSFWVKGSRAVSLETAGFGNNNKGTSQFEAKRSAVPVTTAWTEVVVPIPDPTKLTLEEGMFFFAEGVQAGGALTLWIDDIRFVHTAVVTNPRPALTPLTINAIAGTSVNLSGTRTVFTVSGFDQTVTHMPAYFDYASSDASVGTVSQGAVHVLAGGSTTITAHLGVITATGAITVNAIAPPSAGAPAPALPASSVISLFSDTYPAVPVDTWSASWDQADVATLTIAGQQARVYTNLVFSGTEFTTHPIDATAMTAFHVDVWIPSGTTFKVKLVDFGADGVFGGGNDTSSELTFNASSTPALALGSWVPLEIPMANFVGLTSRAHLAQLIFSGDTRTVFVDNVYFHL